MADVAASHGVHLNSLSSWVKRWGDKTETVGGVLTKGEELDLHERHRTGDYTQAELAKIYNCSVDYVKKVLKNRGVLSLSKNIKYESTYPQKMLNYFQEWYDNMDKLDKKKFIKIPTWEMFAIKEIGVAPGTLSGWCEKGKIQLLGGEIAGLDYREMAHARDACDVLYEEIMVSLAGNNMWQPLIALFTMKNRTRLKDVKAIELTGKDGKDLMSGKDMGKSQMDELNRVLGISGNLEEMTNSDAKYLMKHIPTDK